MDILNPTRGQVNVGGLIWEIHPPQEIMEAGVRSLLPNCYQNKPKQDELAATKRED